MLMELWVNLRGFPAMPRLLSCPPLPGASPQVLTPHRNPSGALTHPVCLMATPSPKAANRSTTSPETQLGRGQKAKMGTRGWRGRSRRSRGTQTRLIPSLSDPFPRNPGALQALFEISPPLCSSPAAGHPPGARTGDGVVMETASTDFFFFFPFPFFFLSKLEKMRGRRAASPPGCAAAVRLQSRAGLQGSQCPSWWYSPGGDVMRFWLPSDVPQNVSWAGQGKHKQLVPEAVAAALKP